MGYYNLPPTQYAQELNDLEKLLRALPTEGAIAGLDLLETLLRNILQNPGEAKYRKVRATNEKLAPLFGLPYAKDVMAEIGWQEEGEFMVLPQGVQVDFQAHIVKVLEAKSHFGKQKEIEKRSAKLAADPTKADLLRQLELDRRERAANGVSQVVASLQQETAADLPIAVARPAPTAATAQAANGGYPAAPAVPSATGTGTFAPAPAAGAAAPAPGSKPKSAFDFESRARAEQKKQDAQLSLAELRAQQKEKYKDFQADPNAKNSEAYKRPPSSANGPPKEAGWFDWLWGDSSSSSSGGGGSGGGGGRPGGGQQGPRMKTLRDLPAPVRRGG